MIDLKIPRDWKKRKIGEVAHEVSERNDTNEELPVLSCTKYDGLVDSLEYFGRRVFSEDTSNYKVVPRNCFAYATNHIEEGSIGYQNIHGQALISPIYTVFKTSAEVNDAYLFFLFKTELYRHIFEINTSASVDRRGSLRWKEFSQIEVLVPPINEQKRIVEILATWDRSILMLRKLIDVKTRLKKGLFQELLAGKTRLKGFSDSWKNIRLGDLAEIYQPKTISQKDLISSGYPVYGANGPIGFYGQYNHETWQIMITCRGATCGSINKTEGKAWITGNAMVVNTDKFKINKLFLYYLLSHTKFSDLITGSGQPQIIRAPLVKLEMRIPQDQKEQDAITAILQCMDREIKLLENKLKISKDQKKGLTQKLLTGKIRVKI